MDWLIWKCQDHNISFTIRQDGRYGPPRFSPCTFYFAWHLVHAWRRYQSQSILEEVRPRRRRSWMQRNHYYGTINLLLIFISIRCSFSLTGSSLEQLRQQNSGGDEPKPKFHATHQCTSRHLARLQTESRPGNRTTRGGDAVRSRHRCRRRP